MLTPEETVDGINKRFGTHSGVRALHAKGITARGTFTATPEAKSLTKSAHMQGEPVQATVRLSNGSGDPNSKDYEPDVRGMAVTFELPDGSRTDISSQTVPHFPVTDHDAFVELVRASEPNAHALWRFPLFLAKHPKALATLRKNAKGLRPPTSYATRRYYAIHAFKWVDAGGGEQFVRYTWVPENEEKGYSPKEAKGRGRDYLFDEIRERLDKGPVRFTLELQIASEGDDPDDPSTDWPDDRRRVNAGTLEIERIADETGDDRVYDPARVTDGIELSNDPILNFRPRAYSVSADRRIS